MKPAVFLYGVPGQYGNYAAALEAAGARVVLCRDLYRSLDCDGLLLPGGGDIRGDMVHPTRAEGIMAQLLGEHPAVTSCHHQAADRLAEPLRPVQWAEDGVIEAVVHQELPVLGVQWHPERQSYALRREDAPDAREIFRYFVSQMKETP